MNRESPEARTLDAVVEEARARLVPPNRDWAKIEAQVVARVAHEGSSLARDQKASPLRSRVVLATSALLAAAAALVLVIPHEGDSALLEHGPTAAEPPAAGALRSTQGEGEVKIAGAVATVGHALRAGDLLEVAGGAHALFERPRKVTWLVEGGEGSPAARARVKSAGETLVLGLEEGAIEAQVAPVATGEAFAIDVATEKSLVRIAVHGTHLRVARVGTKVIVDLSEGVVSIGTPPRVGSTYGTLVTAPAHVELDAEAPATSLKIDHAASSVRAPASFSVSDSVITSKDAPQAPGRGALPVPPSKKDGVHPESTNPPPLKTPKGMPTVPARDIITAAVRECAKEKGRPSDVKVTVNSVLRLKVQGGEILSAQFDPPLAPEIQTCVTPAIYKSKMDEQGIVTIPIEFSY